MPGKGKRVSALTEFISGPYIALSGIHVRYALFSLKKTDAKGGDYQ
jgi:hypothetical protein